MIVIDLDKIFEKQLRKYMKENSGKFTEAAWEEEIARLYADFGNLNCAELGSSPNTYYNNLSSEELAELLVKHVETSVPVPDFLCTAAGNIRNEDAFISLLKSGNEEVKSYALAALRDMNSSLAADLFFEMLSGGESSDLKDMACEILVDNCESVKEKALEFTKNDGLKEYMSEILVRCKPDERIFNYLISEFLVSGENLALYASYLAVYGDERALSYLLTEIEREDINYSEYREIKNAIEALGGEYTKERDFSSDYAFKKISSEEELPN